MDVRWKLFIHGAVMHHPGYSQTETVDPAALEAFKARLSGVLGSLIWWVGAPPMIGGLEADGL